MQYIFAMYFFLTVIYDFFFFFLRKICDLSVPIILSKKKKSVPIRIRRQN